MTKWAIALLAAAALVVPATAYADQGNSRKSPAHQCRAERTANAMGFKEKYGTNKNKSNAFGKCVSQKAKEHEDGDDNDGDNRDNAADLCRAERSKDAAAFKEKYGTNNKANAFGKCVSKTAHGLNKSDEDDDAGPSGDDHGQSGDDHGQAGEDHGPPS